MAKNIGTPFEQLMQAFEDHSQAEERRPLSLKQKGEAIEQARDFYRKGDYTNCAQSLMTISDDPLVAPVDIATQIIGFSRKLDNNNPAHIKFAQEVFHAEFRRTETEGMSRNEALKAYLTRLIQTSDKKMFLEFLNEEKSSNAVAQLEEAMPADLFARMLSMFNHDEVSPLGDDGKEESDTE